LSLVIQHRVYDLTLNCAISPFICSVQKFNLSRQSVIQNTLQGDQVKCRLENRVVSRICGPERDEATGELRNFHSEELLNLYSSQNIIRQIKSRRERWADHVARMGKKRNVYKVLVGNPEGKRPLGRRMRRWEGEIRMARRWADY
jgi:hypothetical protein